MKKLLFSLAAFLFLRSEAQILVSGIPDVTGGDISAVEFDSTTNKIYIAGDFTQVGSVARTGFAVIDMLTGTVLPDFSCITIQRGSDMGTLATNIKMQIFHNKLYVTGVMDAYCNGLRQDYFFTLDLSTEVITPIYSITFLSDFKIYNNKIYTTGAWSTTGPPDKYMVSEMDTMGNIQWQKSISTNAADELECLDVRNNNLFVGGQFSTFNGLALRNIAKIDLTTHTVTAWQPSPLPGNTPNTCFMIRNISLFPNDVLLNINQTSCNTPQHNTAFYDLSSGTLNNQDTILPYQADFTCLRKENDTSFWYNNNNGLKLFSLKKYTAAWSPTSNVGLNLFFRKTNYLFVYGSTFTTLEGTPKQGLGVYCLAPSAPVPLVFPVKVCKRTNNITYSVIPDPNIVNYNWTYSASGVTINGSGPSVTLDFSATAQTGFLKVSAQNYCGATSTVLSTWIIVYNVPVTNAGPDIHFTCTHITDALNPTPNNSSCSYSWTGPNNYSSTAPNNIVNNSLTGGNYIFVATNTTTTCHNSDTLKIIFDTLRPVVNHLAGNYVLTCATTSLTLDAAANYPLNDALHWVGPSLSQNNPVSVTNAGTYTLTITAGTNGCKNKDSVVVGSNTINPDISVNLPNDSITCLVDSIQLHALSTTTTAVLFWIGSNGDTLANNSYGNQQGTYIAHATDLSNGCKSQTSVTLFQNTTLPNVQITAGSHQINCSYDSTILNGSSQTSGAQLQWSGPGSFSSSNPAIATLQGNYFLEVTDPHNGCKKKDSLTVSKQNILLINSSNDTTICNGSSATINSSPIGGNPGFTYLWSTASTSNSISVFPTDTTSFIITITDNAGCSGSDTITINVPKTISDSVIAFMPCDPNHPNGQLQAYPKGGIPPYRYSLNSGSSQSNGVFPNLAFGTYTVTIKDTLGCTYQSSASIDSTSIMPSADFILSTSEIKGDTFVIVDISNPRPDSISWIFPAGCQVINTDPFAPQIINSDTGSLQITMLSWFGTCEMSLTKNITVMKFDTSFATNYNNNGIKDVILYPNPNTGNFTVDISLYKTQTFALFIFDAAGNELLRMPFPNLNFVSAPVHLSNAAPGTYLLKVIAEYDSRSKTFLISQ